MKQTERKKWVRKYANRMLELWQSMQSPLGVAGAYVEKLEKDLEAFYDEPLKKMLIERTY